MNITDSICEIGLINNNTLCVYAVQSFTYLYIIVFFSVLFISLVVLLTRIIVVLKKLDMSKFTISYAKLIITSLLYLILFVLIRLFLQIFEIHDRHEYNIAYILVFGLVIVNMLKRLGCFYYLLIFDKINYDAYYTFKIGKGYPIEVDFWHVTLDNGLNPDTGLIDTYEIPILHFLFNKQYKVSLKPKEEG